MACSGSDSNDPPVDAGAPDTSTPIVDASADVTADAPTDAATCSATTDLQTDFKNCGRCGHACLGGACTAGICQPYRITSSISGPRELLYVGGKAGTLYFTNGDGDVNAQGIGYEYFRVLAVAQGNIRRLAFDGVALYWAVPDNGTISRCEVAGCAQTPQVIASGQASPFDVAYDSAEKRILWTDHAVTSCTAPDGTLPGDIRSAQTDGGDQRILIGDAGTFPSELATTNGALYWTIDRCNANVPEGTLLSLANGTRTVLASATLGNEVADLVADDAGAAITIADGGLFTAPPSTERNARALRVGMDATYIYWTTEDGLYWVKRTAAAGAPPEGSISLPGKLSGPLAVAEKYLYFTQGISIYAVAKP